MVDKKTVIDKDMDMEYIYTYYEDKHNLRARSAGQFK
jgi:hypothetical protein